MLGAERPGFYTIALYNPSFFRFQMDSAMVLRHSSVTLLYNVFPHGFTRFFHVLYWFIIYCVGFHTGLIVICSNVIIQLKDTKGIYSYSEVGPTQSCK